MSRLSSVLAALVLSTTGFTSAAQAAVEITIDKSTQEMVVAQDGRPLYHWSVSTGRPGYDTPNGKFRAFRMEKDHFSKEWDDAPMPFSIFFTQKGHAIHGYLDTRNIGRPASHGCVRLTKANAEKLFALVERDGVLNTTVTLTGQTPRGEPAVAKRRLPRPDDLDQNDAQAQQPQYAPRYGANQPAYDPYAQRPQYGQPYYAQPQYAQPAPPNTYYRDPYADPYQQRRGSLFPF
jgi:hypothetical protein